MLKSYEEEMESYKDRKFRVHKELECIQFGLEKIADEESKEAFEVHLKHVDKIKSRVGKHSFEF